MSSIVCGCGRAVETQPDWAGQWITCPGCNGALYAPFPGAKPSEPSVAEVPVAAATRICPLCAETIPAADAICKYCNSGAVRAPRPRPRPAPVPADPGTGVASLIVSALGFFLCGLLFPVGWILGSNYEAECRRLGIQPSGVGQAGKILGIIGTVLLLLGVLFMVVCAVHG